MTRGPQVGVSGRAGAPASVKPLQDTLEIKLGSFKLGQHKLVIPISGNAASAALGEALSSCHNVEAAATSKCPSPQLRLGFPLHQAPGQGARDIRTSWTCHSTIDKLQPWSCLHEGVNTTGGPRRLLEPPLPLAGMGHQQLHVLSGCMC